MNIGDAARASGVSARMIRHYETLGLIRPDSRGESGYRRYGEAALRRLSFIRRERDLGFSLADIAGLLSLWDDPHRTSADVKRLAARHLADLERRIADLATMRDALAQQVAACDGDHRPGCPILGSLADRPLPVSLKRAARNA